MTQGGNMKKIYAFDFDGTITTCDSLVAIIRYVSGNAKLAMWIVTHIHLLILMKVGAYSNNKLKQQLCRHIFAGMRKEELTAKAEAFAMENKYIIRPEAMQTIKNALNENSAVCVISASPSIWVKPFFKDCHGIEFLCTELETDKGVITGGFAGNNCYGQEKVNKLVSRYPDRDGYKLIAFGDSKGDKELLAFADEAHYKPFRH